MPTLNEGLQSAGVRHMVGIQRLSAGVLRQLIPILTEAEAKIIERLLARQATLEGNFTSSRLDQLLRAVRTINHDAHVQVGATLRRELRGLAKYEAEFQKRMIETATPNEVRVKMEVASPDARTLNALVTSRPLSGRLLSDWVRDLEVGTRRRIEAQIRQGMVLGESYDAIVRRIRGTRALNYRDGVMEVSRRQAQNVVRTAVNEVSTAAREALYEENDDLVDGVQWVATLDTTTCPECGGLDGQVFGIKDGPRPPAHFNCRCTTVPVIKSWRQLGINLSEAPAGTRASIDGQVAATMTYQRWLKSQSAAVQDEALGPTRGALFRRGGLTVDRFTDSRGNHLTLDQLRRREGEAFDKANIGEAA